MDQIRTDGNLTLEDLDRDYEEKGIVTEINDGKISHRYIEEGRESESEASKEQ